MRKNRKFYERAKNRPLSGIGSCASEISVGGTKKMTFNLYDSGYSSVGCSQRILFNIHRGFIRSWYNKYFQVFYECTKCIPTKTCTNKMYQQKHVISAYHQINMARKLNSNLNSGRKYHTQTGWFGPKSIPKHTDPWLLTWFDLMYWQTYP